MTSESPAESPIQISPPPLALYSQGENAIGPVAPSLRSPVGLSAKMVALLKSPNQLTSPSPVCATIPVDPGSRCAPGGPSKVGDTLVITRNLPSGRRPLT